MNDIDFTAADELEGDAELPEIKTIGRAKLRVNRINNLEPPTERAVPEGYMKETRELRVAAFMEALTVSYDVSAANTESAIREKLIELGWTPPGLVERAVPEITGDTSDGYHTFNELYEFRKVYNAALFNEWAAAGKYNVHKSWRHHDGEDCFGGGWFIVVAVLPTGQISNHYAAEDWGLFNVPECERAKFEFDGHTSEDVLLRLKTLAAAPGAGGGGVSVAKRCCFDQKGRPVMPADGEQD